MVVVVVVLVDVDVDVDVVVLVVLVLVDGGPVVLLVVLLALIALVLPAAVFVGSEAGDDVPGTVPGLDETEEEQAVSASNSAPSTQLRFTPDTQADRIRRTCTIHVNPIDTTARTCHVLMIRRVNTILYCARWEETARFYGEVLELPVTFRNEWFVEFEITPGTHLSVADQSRSSIAPNHGAGITLSWEVPDVAEVRRALVAAGVDVSPIGSRFGSAIADLFDPEHNRIELWSQ